MDPLSTQARDVVSWVGPVPGVRWSPAIAAGMATVAIPFYLGLVALPFRIFIVYAGVTGVAMTAGTILDREGGLGFEPVKTILAAVGLWTLVTLVLGGCAYFLAEMF